MRLIFFGTPEFAVPSLQALVDRGDEVAAVVCPPDRPAGRGQRFAPPPVKVLAEKLGLTVLQPERLRPPEVQQALRAHAPELIVVAAYGKILPPAVLELPPRGCINVHASLLPRYRGAAPIQWAILRGEAQTGITIMQMNEGMDTGAILLQRATEILPGETYGELQDRLARLGGEALSAALEAMARGELHAIPQNEAEATIAPKIDKEQGRIDWGLAAEEIERRVRAFHPWPSAYSSCAGQLLKVHRAAVVRDRPVGGPDAGSGRAEAGEITAAAPQLIVACATGSLRLDEVQPAGKQRMSGAAFARGARLAAGDRLG